MKKTKKLTLKKDIVAQLNKSQLSGAVGANGASVLTLDCTDACTLRHTNSCPTGLVMCPTDRVYAATQALTPSRLHTGHPCFTGLTVC